MNPAHFSLLFCLSFSTVLVAGAATDDETSGNQIAQPAVANPADALPWPPEDMSPCRGRMERLWDGAVTAARVVTATVDECADYLGDRQQVYVDVVARFAPIQPPQIGLTLMTEELISKLGKHGTRCLLRGLVKGTMPGGEARTTAIRTIDAIGEISDFRGDVKKAMGIVTGLWRTGGLDTFQLDLQKARFEGLLDLKARDRLVQGPRKHATLFEGVRELFQDGESRSRETLAGARESVRQCRFDDSEALFDRAVLDALPVLHETRTAIRSAQSELRCDEESGGSWDRPGLQLDIQAGMELEQRLRDYIHGVAQEKAAAQEERRRVGDWIGRRQAAMKEAEGLIDAGDLPGADARLRHLENVQFKVCPDEAEWQAFLALRRKLYDRQQQAAQACGDISGSWSNAIPQGSSTWQITRNANGQYEAVESGMGNARSTSVTLSGRTLRLAFVTGGVEGYYQWQLDADCKEATEGVLVFTRGLSGSYRSTLQRTSTSADSGQGPETDWFCCEWTDPGTNRTTCGPMKHPLVCTRDRKGSRKEGYCNAFTARCTK